MNAALSSAFTTVGVAAPRQLAATKSECKSLRAAPIIKRPLSFPSMNASFSRGLAMVEGASQMRNAVANHDLVTPVVSVGLIPVNGLLLLEFLSQPFFAFCFFVCGT